MKRLMAVAMIATCCVLGGCATVNQMAFDKKTSAIDTTSKSVILMTIDVSRPDESRFVPTPIAIKLEIPGAQSKEERQNFKVDKDEDAVDDGGHTIYLARMALAPGKYTLGEIFGMARAFPINGMFVVPLYMELTIKPNSITYIGRVTAKLRPRQDGEFRAGPLLPLIDQSVSGMSGSTWDITVDDMFQKDIPMFRTNYPVLNTAHIETSPLPSFDRAAAQRRWDGESNDKKTEATSSLPAARVQ